ncbi:MAG TPA: DMT family transporter [Casimicrobiaceae bacterium]|nr:DMT family transporter [Casimicrobiaceae bacterium]
MSLIGPVCAVIGILGFSFKAILIKLAYSWGPIDPITLLTLRMIYSVPFFALMAWWATRSPDAKPMKRPDWLAILWLGFIGYYLASLLDFIGLQYITASLERLVLFLNPTMVVLLSMVLFRQRVGGRTWWRLFFPTPAFCSSSSTIFASPATPRVSGSAPRWCSRRRSVTRFTWSARDRSSRASAACVSSPGPC